MSIKTSGHGFVSKAENTQMVAYSTNKNANQQTSAIFKPLDFGLAILAFGLLAFWKLPPWLVVVLTAVGGEVIAYI